MNESESRGAHWTRRDFVPALLIVLAATVIMLPIFIQGFPKVGDADKHYRWSTEFAQAMADGAIYPRWFPEANHGMGSPLPIYYPPVPFYVTAAFNALSGNMLTAMALACGLALALSGLTMYAFSRLLLSRAASLLAALLYLLIPYHTLDLYAGAALSEFWAFVWVPLLFYLIARVSGDGGWRAVLWLAASYALLLQTHVPSLYLTSLAMLIFAVSLTRDWRRLARVGAGLAFGVMLSAVFIAPVLFERKYIQLGRVLLRCDYRQYFLFENLGLAFRTILHPGEDPEYSLQTDMAALGLLLLLIIAGLLVWQRRKAEAQSESPTIISSAALRRAVFTVTAFTLLLSTRLTAPLWKAVPGLPFLLFPFRWLVITSAGAALLVAAAVSQLTRPIKGRLVYAAALALAIIFNLTVSTLTIAHAPRQPELPARWLSRREAPEYHPVWWDDKGHSEFDDAAVVVANGKASVETMDASGIKQSYAVTATEAATLKLRPLYFPGWVARVDGQSVAIKPSAEGNIELLIEPGAHSLTLSFEDTWPRRAGKIISLASLLAFLVLLYVTRHTRPTREPEGASL